MTTEAGQIAKGDFVKYKEDAYLVADREFVNPGKGSAFVRLKLKNVVTGAVIRQTYKTHETLEEIQVETHNAQYLYMDPESYHFMDTESFEQYAVPVEGLEDRKNYLKEGENFQVVFWEHRPIDIKIPYKMVFKVTVAEDAIKGDTVTGATKPVTLETGLVIRVPLFIKEGEKVLINTETGEYLERVN
jgi:elongation factor P